MKNSIKFIFEKYVFGLCLLTVYVDSAAKSFKAPGLSDLISHYETLNYPKSYLLEGHARMRRSLDLQDRLHLNFIAHQRNFNLRLKRDTSIFADGLEAKDGFLPSNLYDGTLEGDSKSRVHGFIYDDIFEGRIHFGDGSEFFVESVKQYPHLNQSHCHSVIYDAKDIIHPTQHVCGGIKSPSNKSMNTTKDETKEENNYVTFDNNEMLNVVHHRERRAFDVAKTECQLYMRADWTYSKWAGGATRAMYIMTQHVKSVSHTYEITDFNSDGTPDKVSLKIKKIVVMDRCSTPYDNSISCQFSPENIGVEKFLDIASLGNNEGFCLSYVFAHRDFSGGVLGLAWIGDKSTAGGICDTHQTLTSSSSVKTLNSGIVTNLNYGKTVANKVTDITLAHEIGHNFGSQHDPATTECSPGGVDGNFIMYPRATSGSDKNNYFFSACSKANIWAVLEAKSSRCFVQRGSPICGNRVVEDGEECDCGYTNEKSCEFDICCNGQSTSSTSTGCKFSSTAKSRETESNKRCSPSNGFCCDVTTCSPFTNTKMCSNNTDCTEKSFCDSSSYKCPSASQLPNNTKCNDQSNVCINGECTGSLCLASNLLECQCTNKDDQCKVCCKDNNNSGCAVLNKTSKQQFQYLPAGSPCNGYSGYCDIFQKCRQVDAEGPLSRLKKWIFSGASFDTVLDWMKEYWWACVLIGLALVLFMAGFIACCSVHTPSSNPNRPPARPMTIPRGFSLRSRGGNRPTAPSYGQPNRTGYNEQPLPGYDTAVRDKHRQPPNYNGSMEMH